MNYERACAGEEIFGNLKFLLQIAGSGGMSLCLSLPPFHSKSGICCGVVSPCILILSGLFRAIKIIIFTHF